IAKKQAMEAQFTEWANAGHKEYSSVLSEYNKLIAEQTPYEMAYTYFIETGYFHDLTKYSYSYSGLIQAATDETISDDDFNKKLKSYIAGTEQFYKDYNTDVDLAVFKEVVSVYKDFPYKDVSMPWFVSTIDKKYKGDPNKYADYVYKKSLFASKDKIKNFLENSSRKKISKLGFDPMYVHSYGMYSNFVNNIRPGLSSFTNRTDSLQRIYMKGLLEFNSDKTLAADANSTLRIAYGKVEAFNPRDGVKYNYYTTLSGIIEKENPDIYDYVVMPKLKTLYKDKDYGKYGDKDGSMHVCFIASNHTTGGNSGSPALNANGDLIGINFDRNWEGTMSDLNYDISRCRNIMLDIRYCLFVIDKYAGAGHLVEEMTFVE
ncbi:MAG: S46 family peptidase, partial [Bacteroidales bacterium]|nr:S46 family peptidase [Bacteroidales bacterium]